MPEMSWAQMQEEAKSQGFEPHPIGTYNFEVTQSDVVSGTKGGNQISIRLVNLDGPYAGRSVLNRLAPFKNDGTVNGMFFAQLGALGFGSDHPAWGQMQQLGFDQGLNWLAPQLISKRVVAEITHRNFDGLRDNVKRMKPYGGPAIGAVGPTPGIPGTVPQVPQVPQPVAPAPVAQPVVPVPTVPSPVPVAANGMEQVTPVTPAAPSLPATPPMPQAPVPPQVAPMAPVPPPVAPGVPVAVEDDGTPVVAQVPLTAVPPLPGQAPQAAVPTPPQPADQAPPF